MMDAVTSKVLDSYTDVLVSKAEGCPERDDDNDSADDDDFLELLEQDSAALDAFREKRMQELHTQMKAAKRLHETGHGILKEVATEKEVLEITTTTKYTVVHFFLPGFKRCEIMDSRLKALTAKHMETRFISVNVETATFLVVRLGIQVLPCVMCFIDGKEVGRLVGFESLGNSDQFTSEMLEFQLQKSGVIQRKIGKLREGSSLVLGFAKKAESDDNDDDDWD
ncbi:thioredoxin-like protein [Lipomyces tetrasporus]|uniref:Thioredoxin-like protein n=1 Tax=Lipomyces tetrasporus TaxID=54092 RepID=A0AAD7QW36_9ASCO|nr:thioredoxin-like protein [Lipomyces tetrasporus]KAJ8102582.1 thioredoxin-like protein [Lipomyces tetrasporus]